MQSSEKIVSALRSGNIAAALSDIERQLAAEPHDCELLGLKALALALGNRHDEAADWARQALAQATTSAQRLKHAANLARLLERSGRREDIAALADMNLPDLGSMADGEIDGAALESICTPLTRAGQAAFVARFLAPILDRPESGFQIERLWLAAAHGAGQHAEILARFDSPSYRWHDQPEATAHACSAANQLAREPDFIRLFRSYLAAAPFHVAPRQQSQIMTVVQIAMNPEAKFLTEPQRAQHYSGNYPSQVSKICADRYRFISVFAGGPPRSAGALINPGEPAITLNNCVNGEQLRGGDLAQVQAHEQALGLPVVNAAEKAVHCTRVETAELVRGIPNLIVPKAMRFRLDAALVDPLRQRISELFAFPVILRSVGEQEGANIHLARNGGDLPAILNELLGLGCKDFYVIDYAGVEHENGFYRRIRAGFVEGTPTLIRADYDDQWMVRGRKFPRILDHYRRDPALFARANAVVEQPQRIGQAAWEALREVGRRIPLDVFGMDFDVDSEGRVVFFESNATMLLLSNAPPDLDYPQDAQRAFLDRIDTLFRKRAGLLP